VNGCHSLPPPSPRRWGGRKRDRLRIERRGLRERNWNWGREDFRGTLGHESAPGLPPVGKVQVGFAEGGEVAADVLSARQIALVIHPTQEWHYAALRTLACIDHRVS